MYCSVCTILLQGDHVCTVVVYHLVTGGSCVYCSVCTILSQGDRVCTVVCVPSCYRGIVCVL